MNKTTIVGHLAPHFTDRWYEPHRGEDRRCLKLHSELATIEPPVPVGDDLTQGVLSLEADLPTISEVFQIVSMSASAGLALVLCLSVFVQYKLTQILEDIGDHRALVLRRYHQNQVSKHFGDLERYIRNIDLGILQVTFQKVMDLAVNAIGHLTLPVQPAFSNLQTSAGRAD